MSQQYVSNGDAERQRTFLRALLALTMSFGVVFVGLNIAAGQWVLATAEASMATYALIIYYGLSRRLSIRLAVWAFLLPFLLTMLLALYVSPLRSVFVWTLLIPVLSHRLLGPRAGSIVAVIFLALAAGFIQARADVAHTLEQWTHLTNVLACAVTLFFLSYIHERRLLQADRALRERADVDSLTRLASRPRFKEMFEHARSEAVRDRHKTPENVSLALVDLDHFKRINDTYGHDIGDQVLAAVSARLLELCRPNDLLGRLGGEELAVVMFGLSQHEAVQLAERLRHGVADQPFDTDNRAVDVTLSVGVTTHVLSETTFEALFSEADARLYGAKRGGRNRVQGADVPRVVSRRG